MASRKRTGFAAGFPRASPWELPEKRARTQGRQFRAAGRMFKGRRAAPADVGMELKFHDLDIDDAVVVTGGTIAEDSCVTIAQGTTESTRIGRKCVIRNVGWRFAVELPGVSGGGTAGSDVVRVMLYLDKQTNGATATVAGILESADFQSFNQLANKGRFLILMDRNYDVNSTAGAGDGTTNDFGPNVTSDTFFKKCNIPIEYDNSVTTGAIGSVRTNNIGVLLISRGGLASFESKMRLRFSDA